MSKCRRVSSLMLCFIMVFTLLGGTALTASAASVSSSLGYDQPENSGDYAYWNGSKVVKSGSTTKNEIKWMQAALNYCIQKEGLSASKLTVDGSFGPASKNATIKFQKAAGLTADGSFGPSTIKKMKTVLNDGKATFKNSSTSKTNTTSKSTVTEKNPSTGFDVVYTYVTVNIDTSSMNNWINSMKKANDIACKDGIIVAANVKKTKTVTWKVSKAAIYEGPGITGTISAKYNVPATIQYKVHKHTKNTGYGQSWYYAGGCINTVYTCNCGYRKDIMSWEIPLPDPNGGIQNTKTVIQGLPKF